MRSLNKIFVKNFCFFVEWCLGFGSGARLWNSDHNHLSLYKSHLILLGFLSWKSSVLERGQEFHLDKLFYDRTVSRINKLIPPEICVGWVDEMRRSRWFNPVVDSRGKVIRELYDDEKIHDLFFSWFETDHDFKNLILGWQITEILAWRNYWKDEDGDAGFACNLHVDSRLGNQLKLFVLLGPVNEDDGPFCWVGDDESRQLFKDRFRRGGSHCVALKKFTGDPGDALLIDTYRLFHRASVPVKRHHRDMMQITLTVSTNV